jgi:hypothetical protein
VADLASLLGDYGRAAPVAASRSVAVDVVRRGEEVLVVVGNADPIRLGHKEATRLGQRLSREGHIARRRKEPVEIGFGRHTLTVGGKAAMGIGARLLARAAEVKFLVGGG